MRRFVFILGFWLFLVLLVAGMGCRQAPQKLSFGGGPEGGGYKPVMEEIAKILQERMSDTIIKVKPTSGSKSNLEELNAHRFDMAMVAAGDAHLGRQGALEGNAEPMKNVLAVARLYGAAAQLVVREDSPFLIPGDLKGTRVAIGSPGSGAALAAERLFRELGIWKEVIPIYTGYDLAKSDFLKDEVQALWLLSGVPTATLKDLAEKVPLRLLDLAGVAREAGLFEIFPFYTPVVIPSGTYRGIDSEVKTFQDQEVWVASNELDEDFVYHALKAIFQESGLERMREVHPAVSRIAVAKGLEGIPIPLHPGATRFWKEQGVAPTSR